MSTRHLLGGVHAVRGTARALRVAVVGHGGLLVLLVPLPGFLFVSEYHIFIACSLHGVKKVSKTASQGSVLQDSRRQASCGVSQQWELTDLCVPQRVTPLLQLKPRLCQGTAQSVNGDPAGTNTPN